MPKKAGPERSHFGGETGLIMEEVGGIKRYFWRCKYCGWCIGGKTFANQKARIHLAGEPTLKNGLVSQLCPSAPETIRKQMAEAEIERRQKKKATEISRKRGAELMAATPPEKRQRGGLVQSPLPFTATGRKNHEEVDDAWGLAFFGLDIAPHKIDSPLFKEAVYATQQANRFVSLLII